mmetsp:Transcript_18361/g.39702  ORF Transcript_18361/g.39702 Transcript_18361/m.39702 type:complete len:123 (-) Transcript_18361:274-642(-)|eukprot:CAMPEP_0172309942 /NCGR_PEP_ID=MMETSP1058-20130122/10980_1 /TAXON_ID=83371 /ORGANISM="Detonula confervacea, Strain CCMP 353" /LENGTH=122 /DNA_ID=CAMNT_0013022665 /DNA_START=139 /DNA_END=507 /DNA_ORIENTATION=+
MRVITLLFAIGAIIANTSTAQDYQDYADGYEQDNLYENYATKQQEKGDGGGGNGLGKAIAGFGISYLVGAKVHSSRVSKKMKTKHLKDQKALYTQYYNDVYKLEDQKAQQQAVIEQLQAALA